MKKIRNINIPVITAVHDVYKSPGAKIIKKITFWEYREKLIDFRVVELIQYNLLVFPN